MALPDRAGSGRLTGLSHCDGEPAAAIALRRTSRLINGVDDALTALIVLAATALTGVAVIFRYVFNDSITWSDEVSRLLLVWMVFIGSEALLKRGGHFGLEFSGGIFGKLRRVTASLSELVGIAFAAALLWYGWEFAFDVGSFATTGALEIQNTWIYVAIPICGGLYVVRSIGRLARIIRGLDVYAPEHQE